ncbi:MAG: hypothetical protein BWY81_00284 [Firmicutes bacterium ADurb.Bin467]|nr:MAG: hypothetical protein BWY81_00284 [Firmicutes bacterium ADurb.Bin467]
MNNQGVLEGRTKAELIDLIGIYAKNWLALDGLWFQSVERKLGMDEAMFHDEEAWRSFAAIEARRLKAFLNLPERAGLEGLARALELRFYSNLNAYEIVREADRLVFRNVECRVQSARARKNMPFHPCKSVGVIDYTEFSKAIDDRIRCRCISCYPDVTDESVSCSWEFSLNE